MMFFALSMLISITPDVPIMFSQSQNTNLTISNANYSSLLLRLRLLRGSSCHQPVYAPVGSNGPPCELIFLPTARPCVGKGAIKWYTIIVTSTPVTSSTMPNSHIGVGRCVPPVHPVNAIVLASGHEPLLLHLGGVAHEAPGLLGLAAECPQCERHLLWRSRFAKFVLSLPHPGF